MNCINGLNWQSIPANHPFEHLSIHPQQAYLHRGGVEGEAVIWLLTKTQAATGNAAKGSQTPSKSAFAHCLILILILIEFRSELGSMGDYYALGGNDWSLG